MSIDTSVADAVLLAATSNAAHAQALTDAALALPGVDAMIAKEHRYIPGATATAFGAALLALPARIAHSTARLKPRRGWPLAMSDLWVGRWA